MNELQDHKCQQCEHIHRAATHCGHQTIETIRVGNGRYDFGRGVSVWREIVTDECRCDLRQGKEPFNPRHEMTEGTWSLPDD